MFSSLKAGLAALGAAALFAGSVPAAGAQYYTYTYPTYAYRYPTTAYTYPAYSYGYTYPSGAYSYASPYTYYGQQGISRGEYQLRANQQFFGWPKTTGYNPNVADEGDLYQIYDRYFW